jgi:hypothetical protein
MALQQIQENDQLPVVITLTFEGAASVPTTLRWKHDCKTTQSSVLEWADITPGSTVNLTVPASANAIINSNNAYETKRITVQANAGTDEQINAVLDYDVVNNFAYE